MLLVSSLVPYLLALVTSSVVIETSMLTSSEEPFTINNLIHLRTLLCFWVCKFKAFVCHLQEVMSPVSGHP